MQFSSITRKGCKCEKPNCLPTISYEGWNYGCAPQEVLERLDKKTKRKNAAKLSGTKLRGLAYLNPEVKGKDYKSKSQLLKEADRLFSLFIRNRDTNKRMGTINCIGCNKIIIVEAKDSSGKSVVQCLHFADRDIYNLRFLEDNAHAGCCYCNLDMHLNGKKSKAYINYRNYLVEAFGESVVAEMELEHRKINKITEQDLKNIIEHYSINL